MALHQRIEALETVIKNMGQNSVGQKPRTKITPWRVLNSLLVLGLGTYKAAATYRGQTIGPTTTDWIIGVFWTLISYWVSLIENSTSTHSSWFFTYDLSGVVRAAFLNFLVLGASIGAITIQGVILGTSKNTVVAFFAKSPILYVILGSLIGGAIGWMITSVIVERWMAEWRWPTLRTFPRIPSGLLDASDWSILTFEGSCLAIVLVLITAVFGGECTDRLFALWYRDHPWRDPAGPWEAGAVSGVASLLPPFFASGVIRAAFRFLTTLGRHLRSN
ncbi:hypothetical protein B0H13DRAFT_2007266 [Mycena leptocephala]|nr:hypothetical protein B0H13DRAFT_2007266 [Mycena leptocephala]